MEDRKEYILNKAFDVFMEKGYDSASITVLQKELNMSRGAMYRYFKSKDELFIAVIDKYFFEKINTFRPYNLAENFTLKEVIDYIHKYHTKVFKNFDKITSEFYFLNYTALIIQAAKHYPDFLIKINQLQRAAFAFWKTAILNGINKNEIKKDVDIDILAGLFLKGAMNPESISTDFNFTFSRFIDSWKRSAEFIYSFVKV